MTIQVSNSAKGNKTIKVSKLKRFQDKWKNDTLSISAVCRYIDNAIKHEDKDLALKENALIQCKENGTFKTVSTLLNDKQKVKGKKFSPWTIQCIINKEYDSKKK